MAAAQQRLRSAVVGQPSLVEQIRAVSDGPLLELHCLGDHQRGPVPCAESGPLPRRRCRPGRLDLSSAQPQRTGRIFLTGCSRTVFPSPAVAVVRVSLAS